MKRRLILDTKDYLYQKRKEELKKKGEEIRKKCRKRKTKCLWFETKEDVFKHIDMETIFVDFNNLNLAIIVNEAMYCGIRVSKGELIAHHQKNMKQAYQGHYTYQEKSLRKKHQQKSETTLIWPNGDGD